jgi:hypothetical protein
VGEKVRIKNFWDDLILWLGGIVFVLFLVLWMFLFSRKQNQKIHEYRKREQEIEMNKERGRIFGSRSASVQLFYVPDPAPNPWSEFCCADAHSFKGDVL